MRDEKAAVEWLSSDETAARVFDAIEQGHGKASGWAIAKKVELEPETATTLLKKLKDYELVDSTDAGLDGFYYLTTFGLRLRSGFRHMRVAV